MTEQRFLRVIRRARTWTSRVAARARPGAARLLASLEAFFQDANARLRPHAEAAGRRLWALAARAWPAAKAAAALHGPKAAGALAASGRLLAAAWRRGWMLAGGRLRAAAGGLVRRAGWSGMAKAALGLGLVGAVGAFGIGALVYLSYASEFVPPSELNINQPSAGAVILDRNGNVLYQYVDDRDGLRSPVPLDQISPHLRAATIATEDGSFYDNPGVNARGTLRAVWENLNPLSGSFLEGSGGSSITQQLVKNVYFPADMRDDRSLMRKAREAVYAIELTRRYDKDQILEWYLNQIGYGGLYNGAEAASLGYFGKHASDLTLAEAALLAGLPQSPSAYSPFLHPEAALARRNEVLDLMAARGGIKVGPDAYYAVKPEEIEAAKAEPVQVVPQEFPVQAPHFVFSYVQPQLEALFGKDAVYRKGLVVTTTVDLHLTQLAQQALDGWIGQYEASTNTHNGSVLVMDPRNGEIYAMVGSRDYFDPAIQGENNNVLGLNSPGSSFKPFVYLESFLKLGWAPATAIEDAPVAYRNPDGSIFQPVNPGHNFQGTITLRSALGNSLNVPAFKVAQAAGVPDIVRFARQLGFDTLNGSYGPAVAIGGVDLTQLDLTHGYSILAAGGVMRGRPPFEGGDGAPLEPISILKVTDRRGRVLYDVDSQRSEVRVAPAAETFLVNSILTDANAQCLTFGCGGLAIPGHQAAVKTGTSEPYDPNGPDRGKIGETWAFGYTPEVVVSVWAGNADNAPLTNILSTTIAFRAMRDIMLAYFDGRPSTPFRPPPDVVRAPVCFPSGSFSGGRRCSSVIVDWFVRSRLDDLLGLDGRGAGSPIEVRPQDADKPPKDTNRRGRGNSRGRD